jgi:hypothetical protein
MDNHHTKASSVLNSYAGSSAPLHCLVNLPAFADVKEDLSVTNDNILTNRESNSESMDPTDNQISNQKMPNLPISMPSLPLIDLAKLSSHTDSAYLADLSKYALHGFSRPLKDNADASVVIVFVSEVMPFTNSASRGRLSSLRRSINWS